MEEMRLRFDEIVKYERKEKMFQCEYCPCFKECKNLPEEDYSCEDMFFAYITLGKNFRFKKRKNFKKLLTNRTECGIISM